MDDLKVQQINDRIMSASKQDMKANMETHLVLFYIGGVMLAIYLLYQLGRAVKRSMGSGERGTSLQVRSAIKEKQD